MSYPDLAEKVVLVTGAAQGIGAAYVRRLSREGAKVIATDVNVQGIERLAARAEGPGPVLPEFLDVSSWSACQAIAARVLSQFGRLDGLINNAAIFSTIRMSAFWEISESDWDALMAVNLKGPWQLTSAFVPALIASGRASVVNIGSDAVIMGRTNYAHYLASKGGVAALTFGMSKELGPSGVRVNTLSPGPVYTEIERETVTTQQTETMLAMQAIKRTADPNDMTNLAAFLLSDDSAYITGQTISVNGGLTHR